MKKSNPMKEDIVVFAFKKGSQTRLEEPKNSSYQFVNNLFKKLMDDHNVISNKIAISSHKEDLVNYISSIIDVYVNIYNLKLDKIDDFNQVDFDPDIDDTMVYD